MLDKAIFAHRFEDHVLHPSIKRAYHALAIDDERFSFHPIVFDENVEDDPKRITQVCFPGCTRMLAVATRMPPWPWSALTG